MTRPRAPWSSNFTRAGDLREDRVVLAEADVQAGLEPAAALAHDDRAAGDDVAVVRFDAEPLRVASRGRCVSCLVLFYVPLLDPVGAGGWGLGPSCGA